MRPRLIPALVWIGATVVATVVGFTATHTVGDVIGGTGPVGAEFIPATEAAASDDDVITLRTEEFHYSFGRLTVRCRDRAATLVARAPAPGWEVSDDERGPDDPGRGLLQRGHAAGGRLEPASRSLTVGTA